MNFPRPEGSLERVALVRKIQQLVKADAPKGEIAKLSKELYAMVVPPAPETMAIHAAAGYFDKEDEHVCANPRHDIG